MLTGITINGQTVDPATVEYQVTIQTGPGAQYELPQPTTCSVAIWSDTSLNVALGDELMVHDDDITADRARFRGQVTNVALEHPGPGIVRQNITAMGPLMRLGRATIGYTDLIEEGAAFRISEVCARADIVAVMEPGLVGPNMVAREADDQSCRFMFDEVMRSSPFDVWEMNAPLMLSIGPMFDMCQFGNNDPQDIATAVFVDGTQGDPGYAIEILPESYRDTTPVLGLSPDAVGWGLRWEKDTGRVVNKVSVVYGDYPPEGSSTQRPKVSTESASSIATFGPSTTEIVTDLSDSADAGTRAVAILDAYASSHWEMRSCDLILEQMNDTERRMVMTQVRPGARVEIDQLPLPGPAARSAFYVEGFTESYKPGDHIITLALTAIPTGPQFDLMRFDDADPNSPTTAVFNY